MTNRNLPHEFDTIANRIRTIRIADAWVVVVRTQLLAVSVVVATDAMVRFPVGLRWIILTSLVTLFVWMIRRHLPPALTKPDTRVSLALRAEALLPAAQGRLASGVEFASDASCAENPLAIAVRERASTLISPAAIRALAHTDRIRRDLTELMVVALLWVGFLAISPQLATTGLLRSLTPWITAEWPARTGIRSTTFATHHPKDTALSLRADLFRGDPQSEPVWVRMRTITGETRSAWEQLPLVHQGDTRFERLVESRAEAMEFQFLTRDVESELQQVTFVEAPSAKSIVATITPPAYATALQPQTIDLGQGTNNRGRIPVPILQGSLVTFEINPSGDMVVPEADGPRAEWLASTFFWDVGRVPTPAEERTPPVTTFEIRTGVWVLSWTADRSRTLFIRMRDSHGVPCNEEISCTMTVSEDHAPEAVVLEPATDETVLASAVITLRGEARDDVGLSEVSLEVSRAPHWSKQLALESATGMRVEVSAPFDLQLANAQPGDVFDVVATATDACVVSGTQRPPTRSTVRHIRVLTRPQFEEETRNTITAIRQGVMRVNDRQRALLKREGAETAQVRPQSEIGDRISALGSTMGALRDRLDRNQVPDDAVRGLIDAAEEILQTAHTQSDRARDALQEEPANQDKARLAQTEVTKELDDLTQLLDRDKDAWIAARQLERVSEAIKESQADRVRAAARTLGRTREQLSADETAALDRAADTAEAAAQAAREAVEELNERAQTVEKDDPQRAMNLRQAAERGEQESLAARMDKSGQATRENRMDDAKTNADAAQQTIQNMLADLADDEKARTATLRRRLATLSEALEQLVLHASSTEDLGLDLLVTPPAESEKAMQAVAREASKLSLNASGVADEARAAGPTTQRIVRLIDRGSQSASRAAVALGATHPDIAAGHDQLGRATTVFREALDAVRAQEQKNDERERQERARELAQAYTKLVDRQEGLLSATTTLVAASNAAATDRRALVEARRLAVEQESIKHEITSIGEGSEDVKNSPTFMEATHVAVDAATGAIRDLRAGPPTHTTIELEREIIETLRGLTEALSEASKKEKDPFADEGEPNAAGGGGGGGTQEKPLIPPLAELKVLRALQQRVSEKTRSIHNSMQDGRGGDVASKALAARQAAILKLADDLRAALEEKMRAKASESAPIIVTPPQRGPQSQPLPPTPQPQPPQNATPAPRTDERPPINHDAKSLDELLGIQGVEESTKAAKESARTHEETLKRTLTEQQAQDTLELTIDEMKQVGRLLEENETGTAAQRLHEDILARLDALIQSAQQQQQQSASSSSSSSDSSSKQDGEQSKGSQGKQQSDASGEAARRKEAERRAQEAANQRGEQSGDPSGQDTQASSGERAGELPPGVEAIEGGAIAETEAEWGNLPPRTREVLRQGMREKMSSVYKRWTEAYYRRIAEESKP